MLNKTNISKEPAHSSASSTFSQCSRKHHVERQSARVCSYTGCAKTYMLLELLLFQSMLLLLRILPSITKDSVENLQVAHLVASAAANFRKYPTTRPLTSCCVTRRRRACVCSMCVHARDVVIPRSHTYMPERLAIAAYIYGSRMRASHLHNLVWILRHTAHAPCGRVVRRVDIEPNIKYKYNVRTAWRTQFACCWLATGRTRAHNNTQLNGVSIDTIHYGSLQPSSPPSHSSPQTNTLASCTTEHNNPNASCVMYASFFCVSNVPSRLCVCTHGRCGGRLQFYTHKHTNPNKHMHSQLHKQTSIHTRSNEDSYHNKSNFPIKFLIKTRLCCWHHQCQAMASTSTRQAVWCIRFVAFASFCCAHTLI